MTVETRASRPAGSLVGEWYRIDGPLGVGASGTVYRALHTGTERLVAVKVLHAALLDDAVAVKRFVREARATRQVVHPNVVGVLDAGLDATGRPYLVTELLEGETLATQLARTPGPMALCAVAELALPILDALAMAHARGIVHRDIKPENVFLHRGTEGRSVPKLLDFGVSKRLDGPAATSSGLTIPGAVFGTPHYIAPEQALSSRDVDARADVWSAGVLLYRLLVGRVPFDAPTMGALLGLIFDALPASPAALGVPPGVASVVIRCLAKDRAARYPDAGALRAALCDVLGVPHTAGASTSAAFPSLCVRTLDEPAVTVRPPRWPPLPPPLVFPSSPERVEALAPHAPHTVPPEARRRSVLAALAFFAGLGAVAGVSLACWAAVHP